jgi:heme-degrading monooxygenase HmoA
MTDEPMITDRTDNRSPAADGLKGAVLLVNLFTARPGMEEQFIKAQTDEYVRLRGRVEGWIGNRLGRAVNGNEIVNVAMFETLDHYNAWRASELFRDHVEVIRPFVANSAPGMYQLLYAAGDL